MSTNMFILILGGITLVGVLGVLLSLLVDESGGDPWDDHFHDTFEDEH